MKREIKQKLKNMVGDEIYQDVVRYKNIKYYVNERCKEEEWIGCDGKKYFRSLIPFDKNECIFIHIPKAAGMSVTYSLFGQMTGGHTTATEYRRIFGRDFNRYYKFTFVRNPYKRLASAYNYLKQGGHPAFVNDIRFKKQVIDKFDGFEEFVIDWLTPNRDDWVMPHFRPQNQFLKIGNKIRVDFVGYLDRIEKDFEQISKNINKKKSIQKRNESNNKNYNKILENRRVINRIQKVYKKDFELFGYDKKIE